MLLLFFLFATETLLVVFIQTMPKKQKHYIVKKPDGEELEPVDADVLCQWVREGTVTRACYIRSDLVPYWYRADSFDFLAPLIDEKEEESGEKKRQEHQEARRQRSLARRRVRYTNAPATLRILSGVTDGLILATGVAAIYLICLLIGDEGATGKITDVVQVALSIAWLLGYLSFCTGVRAQTLGQQFWGVMVVRPDAGPVLTGRAFAFAVATVLLWVLTVPHLLIRPLLPWYFTLSEAVAGVRVIRIRVTYMQQ